MNITASALFCWVSNVLHSDAACKFLTGYNKVCVKTLIHLLHRVVMSSPFACSSQAQSQTVFLSYTLTRALRFPTVSLGALSVDAHTGRYLLALVFS